MVECIAFVVMHMSGHGQGRGRFDTQGALFGGVEQSVIDNWRHEHGLAVMGKACKGIRALAG